MYFKASIPIVGPIVFVILTPQYFRKGALPAELFDHSFITSQELNQTEIP